MEKLRGTGVALVTPFNHNKSVDFDALKKLVNYQIDNGINYLVVLGTTGESVTLTKQEKLQVIDTIVTTNNGKLPLVLGVGGNNTMQVCEEIQSIDLNPFDAILSVSPYYNKPSQKGIYEHYSAIAKVSPKPIILYNVPGRTAQNIHVSTILELAKTHSNIIGVKEAAGDMVQAMRIIKDKPKDFMVISGDDMIALPVVLAGGDGVISVIGQALPKDFSNLINLGLKGNVADAMKLQYKIMESIDLIFEEGNPAGIKFLLHKLSLCNPTVRLPLVEASVELQQKISNFVDHY